MNKLRRWLTAGLAAACLPAMHAAEPAGEMVVAIRYLQQTGKSHAHLYLYRQDGKLLRQLTKGDTGQDFSPVFAPDGESIVFTHRSDAGDTDQWSIEPRGGGLHMVAATPDWYVQAKTASAFGYLRDDPDTKKLFASKPGEQNSQPPDAEEPPTLRAPDSSVELVLKVSPTNEDDSYDGEGHGKSYLLRDLKTGGSKELGKLPGFFGLFDLLALGNNPAQRFLLVPPLRVAFFGLHLNSTDGDTAFALDLEKERLVRLSPNRATPIPLPGEAAFLTLAEERYIPFGDGQHTANCSYVDRWDAGLNRVRFAREKAPAVCYGASLYRPGRTPAVVTVRDEPNP